MGKLIVRGQMVDVMKIEEKEIKEGANKGQKFKIAYFKVADRDRHKVGTNEYEADAFYFCKAVFNHAETIANFFNHRDDKGKLISRRIYLELEPKQYENSKEVKVELKLPIEKLAAAMNIAVPDNLKGKDATLNKTEVVKYKDFVFEVSKIGFEDADPVKSEGAKSTGTSTEITIDLGGISPASSTSSDFNFPENNNFGNDALAGGSSLFTQA